MRWLGNLLSCICLAISAVMVLRVPVAYAALPLVPVCSWPVESTGQGILNVATQDTNTTYWFMPIDTSRWKSVVIQGFYPNARFFNFATYGQRGLLIDTLFDSDIVPDSGGSNPFTMAPGSGSGNESYTVNIGASNFGSPNFLSVGGNRLTFMVYRVIVPDKGLDRSGGVGVPTVTLVAQDGSVRQLQPCPFASAESSLGNMIPILIASGFTEAAGFLQGILSAANQQTSIASSCIAGPPGSQVAVSFGPAPGIDFFPNPPTAYLQTPNVCFQPNKIVVVRGRALVYPDTYLGRSVLEPAFDSQVQARYWSMCNNDGVFPYPAIGCQSDFQTRLDQSQFYTYIVSSDPAPPDWLPADATWLPWGPTNIPITMIFRSISFIPGYSPVPSDYEPVGVLCDESLFIAQGWRACFTAAGVNVAMSP
jgi:hypothetical protein